MTAVPQDVCGYLAEAVEACARKLRGFDLSIALDRTGSRSAG